MSDEELARKREHRMMVRAERTGISRQGGWHRRILANFVPQTEKVCGTFLVQNDRHPCSHTDKPVRMDMGCRQKRVSDQHNTRKGGHTMIKEAIEKIVRKEDLTYDEAFTVMNEIMNGETSQTQNAAFLAALSTKSTNAETIDEIQGCAEAMRDHATPVPHEGIKTMEIVGTGGDRAGSFNISTTAAFVLAAGGVKVSKHGNRAASSKSGTADCLEALGVNIDQSPEKCLELLESVGFCFMFAQKYHMSMKYVGAIRKELGFRTVFNILGPLTNPAKPQCYLLGVYDAYLVEPIAKVLDKMGVKNALVVYGEDKLDEISPSAPTLICELKDGYYRTTEITPEDFGMKRGSKDEISGGTAEENAAVTRGILDGSIRDTRRNAVLLNAGAAFYVYGKAASIKEGVELAAKVIDDGLAVKTLEEMIKVSNL